MDDWDDIVAEAGEQEASFEDANDDIQATSSTPPPEPDAPLAHDGTTAKADLDDHDAPANDEEQCRICFCGAEEEPELGVRTSQKD